MTGAHLASQMLRRTAPPKRVGGEPVARCMRCLDFEARADGFCTDYCRDSFDLERMGISKLSRGSRDTESK